MTNDSIRWYHLSANPNTLCMWTVSDFARTRTHWKSKTYSYWVEMNITNEMLVWRVHVTKILVICFISCATLGTILIREHEGKSKRNLVNPNLIRFHLSLYKTIHQSTHNARVCKFYDGEYSWSFAIGCSIKVFTKDSFFKKPLKHLNKAKTHQTRHISFRDSIFLHSREEKDHDHGSGQDEWQNVTLLYESTCDWNQ